MQNGCFADHCKIYQKHPVYWLFSTGKNNGFKALVYMHRWKKDTVSTVLHHVQALQENHTGLADYAEKLHRFRMTDIDLDDGVKVNYAEFPEILEKIK